jgi:hypothetical protein
MCSVSSEFQASYASWNFFSVQNSPYLVHILSQANPVHILPSHFFRFVLVRSHLRLDLPNGLFHAIFLTNIFHLQYNTFDCLCGLVVRVSGYRFRGPGLDSRPYQIFWETGGLERGPLSLVITTEVRLRSRKLRLTAVGICCADHVTPSTRKSRHYFTDSGGRSVGIVRLRIKATEFFYTIHLQKPSMQEERQTKEHALWEW